jgi:hypothetical protein
MGLILGIGNRIGRRSVGANVNQINFVADGVGWVVHSSTHYMDCLN